MSALKRKSAKRPLILLIERGMALLALLNLLLVIFDLSYIPLRDFWLQGRVQLLVKIGTFEQEFPQQPLKVLPVRVTDWYDWVKGIEPNRSTKHYLEKVQDLDNNIGQSALKITEESDLQVIDQILTDLQSSSISMIEDNPFQIANKTGTLERIKNKMRLHVFNSKDASSKEAFQMFWSREYLNKNGLREQLNFFDRQIKPLIETNYFRPVGEHGGFVNNFGLIDFPFFLIFLCDFLIRTWFIGRRHAGLSWFDAMLWRWYDIFLLIPLFRWLRVIPVTIRLSEAGLIDLHRIQKQASQGFVASIAEDLTEVVVIRVVNQVQDSIRQGQLSDFLAQQNQREYIDLNDINETAELFKLMSNLIVNDVMPKIRPDVEALLKHSLGKVVDESTAYQGLQNLPGVKELKTNLTEQLVKQIYQVLQDTLKALIEEDKVFDELLETLGTNFSKSITSEMQGKQSIEKMESLLVALLEEVKVNYVESLTEEDIEQILEQKRLLQATRSSTSVEVLPTSKL